MSSSLTPNPTTTPGEDIKFKLISNEKNDFLIEIKSKDSSILFNAFWGELA